MIKLFIHVVLLTTVLLTSNVFVFAQKQDTRKISIVSTTIFPFHYMKDGKPQGIFIELADKIFEAMNVEATYTILEEKNALELVEKGQYDATLSVSYSPSRKSFLVYPKGFDEGKNFVWVSEYYFFSAADKKSQFTASSLKDLRSKNPKVGIIPGLSYAQEFWEQDFDVLEGPDGEHHFQSLIDGKIDLFLTDKTIGRSILVRDGMADKVAQLPNALFSKPYTMCLAKKSSIKDKDAFLEEFFKTYDLLKKTQDARKIFFKYLRN